MPVLPRGFHLPPFVPVPLDLEEMALHLGQVLSEGRTERFLPIATGFPGLDRLTGGGLHGGDLAVVGGVQNIGKTALVLQWARYMAASGVLALVVCYEHPPEVLWERLLCQAAAGNSQGEVLSQDALQAACLQVLREADSLSEGHCFDAMLAQVPHGLQAWSDLGTQVHRVWLACGDGLHTDLEALGRYVDLAVEGGLERMVLFVDYLQRVPVLSTRPLTAGERIEQVLAGLKGLAMRTTAAGVVLAVVVVGAADAEGLRRGRVHFEDLWGSALMQYEPDLALIGNRDGEDGEGTVCVRWAVEKNRRGRSQVSFRHRYLGASFWFDPQGMEVSPTENWQAERDRGSQGAGHG